MYKERCLLCFNDLDDNRYCSECKMVFTFDDAAFESKNNPADILEEMAETFRERSGMYKNNYKQIGAVMIALYPDGITLKTIDQHNRFHLFLMMLVKMTRLANMDLNHQDSCHDIGVYSAMLKSLQEDPCETSS